VELKKVGRQRKEINIRRNGGTENGRREERSKKWMK
jgi:hypothetical protein